MIDISKYEDRPHTLRSRIRGFIIMEIGPQEFSQSQLIQAMVDHDPVVAKRTAESVRYGAARVIGEMVKNGELLVVGKRGCGKTYRLEVE
jgi:hypothetical protein